MQALHAVLRAHRSQDAQDDERLQHAGQDDREPGCLQRRRGRHCRQGGT